MVLNLQKGVFTYQNMKAVLNLIKVQEICLMDSLVVSCDLKIASNLCAIQSHSSKHPCCWCEVESTNPIDCGHPGTFGRIRKQYVDLMSCEGDI